MAQKSKKNLIFILIIITLLGYIVFDKFQNKEIQNIKNIDEIKAKEVVMDGSKDVVEEKTVTQTTPVKSSSETCIEEKEIEVKSKEIDYTKGSILVSFLADVSFVEAKKIVLDLKYSIDGQNSAENRFESGQKWFVVNVPNGKEIEAICVFEDYPKVKYAGFNILLEFGNPG